jgi:hypothetical protein
VTTWTRHDGFDLQIDDLPLAQPSVQGYPWPIFFHYRFAIPPFLHSYRPQSLFMILYLLFPALLWIVSYQLLTRARGQKGFDTFFWHFILIGLEGVAALLLLNYFQVENGNRIALGVLGIHTVILLMHSLQAFLATKIKGTAFTESSKE